MSPVMPDIPSSGTGKTTAQLITHVRTLLPEGTADLYSDDEVLVILNAAKSWLFSDLDVLPKRFSTTTVGGQDTYTAPSDLGRWRFLKWQTTELTPIRMHERATFDSTIATLSGSPSYYCGEFISTTGAKQFVIYPHDDASGNTLTGFYYAMPQDLDLSGSNPTWHLDFHFAPCWYAVYLLLNKDHRAAASDRALAMAVAEKDRYRSWFIRNAPYLARQGRQNYPSSRQGAVNHDNDPSPIPIP